MWVSLVATSLLYISIRTHSGCLFWMCCHSIELATNVGTYGVIFQAARAKLWPRHDQSALEWRAVDIEKVFVLPKRAQCVFSFWVGMPKSTQLHILKLCRTSADVQSVALFLDYKWRKPAAVLQGLNDETLVPFRHTDTSTVAMRGSGEKKTMWIFSRSDLKS